MTKEKNELDSEITRLDIAPSRFIPYPEKFILLRAFTFDEMKVFQSKKLSDRMVADIFKRNMLNFNCENLSWSDYLFFSTHISLFTEPDLQWTFKPICHFCYKVIEITLNRLKFFEFKDLEIPDYPLWININEEPIEFGVITVENHFQYMEIKDKISEEQLGIYAMALMIKNKPIEESFEMLKNVRSTEVLNDLNEIDTLLDHEAKPMKLECPSCNESDFYEVGLEVSTLLPFRGSETPKPSRIVFGKK